MILKWVKRMVFEGVSQTTWLVVSGVVAVVGYYLKAWTWLGLGKTAPIGLHYTKAEDGAGAFVEYNGWAGRRRVASYDPQTKVMEFEGNNSPKMLPEIYPDYNMHCVNPLVAVIHPEKAIWRIDSEMVNATLIPKRLTSNVDVSRDLDAIEAAKKLEEQSRSPLDQELSAMKMTRDLSDMLAKMQKPPQGKGSQ